MKNAGAAVACSGSVESWWSWFTVAVLLLTAAAGRGDSVSVSWQPSPSTAAVGYKLYYGTASGNYTQVANVGNVTSTTVSGLLTGTTYYFAASCYDSVGDESARSTEVSYTVTSAAVVTWSNPADIIYGTALSSQQLNATANVAGTFTYSPSAGTVVPAGLGQPLTVVFVPTDQLNYSTVTNNVLINVQKAPLQIQADNKTRPQGTANPTFTATYLGWVNGDSAANLSSPVSFSTTAVQSSPPGTYPIVITGGTNPNYTITYVNGTLTVTAVQLVSITVQPSSVTLGQGQTAQLAATGTYSDSSQKSLTASAVWSCSAPTVASVSSSGLVTAVGKGSATIVASLNGVSGSAGVTVTKGNAKPHLVDSGNPVKLEVSAPVAARPDAMVTLSGVPGTRCSIEASSDLIHWEKVLDTTVLDEPTSFLDPGSVSVSMRFFRVQPDSSAE